MAHKWAKWLHNPCRLGAPHRFKAGDKTRGGPQLGKVPTKPLAVETPRRQGLCSHLAHMWATRDSAPRFEKVGTPGRIGYVATLPTCGPHVIMPPALQRGGTPRRQGLCSHLAQLWATSDFAPHSEAVGTPQAAGVTWPPCPLVGHFSFCPPLSSGGDLLGGRGYVATLHTCGPLLILPPALKRLGPPRRQGLCSHLAHLWAAFDSASRFEAVGTPQTEGGMQPLVM